VKHFIKQEHAVACSPQINHFPILYLQRRSSGAEAQPSHALLGSGSKQGAGREEGDLFLKVGVL
jgi:hypothetical protein